MLPVTEMIIRLSGACFLSGSALDGGAGSDGEGQAAIRLGRGVVQQAAPEILVEGGDLAVLLFQNPEEVLHRATPISDVADLLRDCILLALGLSEDLTEGYRARGTVSAPQRRFISSPLFFASLHSTVWKLPL